MEKNTPLPQQSNHYGTVDSLRGVAILLVLILHFNLAYHLNQGGLAPWFEHSLVSRLFTNGNYGVVIFFVISGFLITSRTLLRFGDLKNIQVREFYTFRVARILPNILLMLVIVVGLGWAGFALFQNDEHGPSLFLTVASVITFTHNLLMEKFGYFNYCLNILWSLSVEEVFYLTFPFLCLLAKRKWIPISVWVLFIFISPYYRFLHRKDAEDIYGLYDYLACFDGIAIGCLAAYFRKNLTAPVWLTKLLPLLFLGIAVIYFSGGIWKNLVFGISGASLLTGVALFAMKTQSSPNPSSPVKTLRWIGSHSYELYLFHIIVLAGLRILIPREFLNTTGKIGVFFAFMILSGFAAAGISRYYSEPSNQKIRRYLYQRSW
jgi:peptidoglycan/LPS O-acetylase OafA/YrhL